jgi:hypothetical protein
VTTPNARFMTSPYSHALSLLSEALLAVVSAREEALWLEPDDEDFPYFIAIENLIRERIIVTVLASGAADYAVVEEWSDGDDSEE